MMDPLAKFERALWKSVVLSQHWERSCWPSVAGALVEAKEKADEKEENPCRRLGARMRAGARTVPGRRWVRWLLMGGQTPFDNEL